MKKNKMLLKNLYRERDQVLQNYREHKILSKEAISEKNRIDALINKIKKGK